MIYMPNLEDYECFVVQNEDVIRAYEETPTQNSTINYRDYYINANYIYKDGTQNFSQYATVPICLTRDVLTNDFYYRNDLDSILIIFLIMCIFGIYLPIRLFMKLFKRVK